MVRPLNPTYKPSQVDYRVHMCIMSIGLHESLATCHILWQNVNDMY